MSLVKSVVASAEYIIKKFNLETTKFGNDTLSACGLVNKRLLRITIVYNKYTRKKPCVIYTHVDTNKQFIRRS
jgi:hypothetical protein